MLNKKSNFIIATILSASTVGFSAEYMAFKEACSTSETIQIIGVGDVLLHGPLQYQATQNSKRFKSLWYGLLPTIEQADIAYANLEGPSADDILMNGKSKDPKVGFVFDKEVYTSYPQFNYHSFLIEDLKNSGFDVVSTANNHSLDRFSTGVDKTIEALEDNNLKYTGTQKQNREHNIWHTILRVKNKNIAFLACTFSTNGIKDKNNQVLPCYQNQKDLLTLVKSLSQHPLIDAVIVTPHWGEEYQLVQNDSQIQLGRRFIEAGATAVIGTHPHVLQPSEKYITRDGREGFIIYSTGNFVSGQPQMPRRASVMVSLYLSSDAQDKLKIKGVEFMPLFMQMGNYEVKDARQRLAKKSGLPDEVLQIFNNNFHPDMIMKTSKEASFKSMCELSKNLKTN